jgi:hypothetical protein
VRDFLAEVLKPGVSVEVEQEGVDITICFEEHTDREYENVLENLIRGLKYSSTVSITISLIEGVVELSVFLPNDELLHPEDTDQLGPTDEVEVKHRFGEETRRLVDLGVNGDFFKLPRRLQEELLELEVQDGWNPEWNPSFVIKKQNS